MDQLDYKESLFKSIDQIIQTNIELRPSRESMMALDDFHYVAEYCTVTVDPGRRLWKSSYISERATIGDVLIVLDSGHYNNTARLFSRAERGLPTIARVYNGFEIENATTLCRKYGSKFIWVDDPCYIFERMPFREIVSMMYVNEGQTFVLLGRAIQ